MTNRTAIILAGGESRRMKSQKSKVLHNILGYPVIRYVIDAAYEAGIERVVIVGNKNNEAGLRNVIKSLTNMSASVCLQDKALGTADAVRSAESALGSFDSLEGSVLVLCGDAPLICGQTLTRFLSSHEEQNMALSVLSGQVESAFGYGRIVRDGERFVRIVEERDASASEQAILEINSGCLAFSAKELALLLDRVPAADNGEYYLTRTVDLALSSGMKVAAFSEIPEHEILGINTRGQLAAATKILKARINQGHMDNGVTLVDPESTFIDKNAAIGRDTILEPFVVIEGHAKIGENCRIGPFVRIRGDCVVSDSVSLGNFVELVRSSVGADTRALHLSYIGDAELGAGVNVGAGTVFANWDGKEKHRGFAKDGAFVGSGTIIVQPAGLSEGARTGAGAVVTRTVPAGETWVGVPARPLDKKDSRS